jgi:hypothetical protein
MKKAASKKNFSTKRPDAGESLTIGRLLKRLKSGRDLRRGKVRRVKSALRHDTYFNALKLEVAADRLAGELMGRE